MRCPLPIDWLDYLEGAFSEALTLHLEQCELCQRTIADLKQDASNRSSLKLREIDVNSWQRLSEEASPTLAFGELRWTACSPDESKYAARVLLLLLSDPWPEAGMTWVDAVPVTTDIESATLMDVIFDRTHSELGTPLRLHLRHQLVANSSNVAARYGRLTDDGLSLLREILDSNFERARSGSWNDEAETEPAALSSEMLATLWAIQRVYARLQEDPKPSRGTNVTYIPMVRRKPFDAVREELRLAAVSHGEFNDYLWCAEIPSDGSVCGKIEHDYRNDQLTFVVSQMNALYGRNVRVIIVLSIDRFPESISSEPFVLTPNHRVVVGRQLDVLPAEIKGVELGVLDEG
jgi:hypothetical protein